MDAPAGEAVVVGIDGSDSALRAVHWAAVEAARRMATLRVVTAFAWNQKHALGQVGLAAGYRDVILEAARSQLAGAAAEAEKTCPHLVVEPELIAGYPVPVLQEESRRAQLVVLGDRGYGGVSGLVLGSVAAALAATGECPVVLVRRPEEEPVADRSRPVVVGVDGSPVSEAALAFAFDLAKGRGVALVAVHTWWDVPVDPALALLIDWEAIEIDERAALADRLTGWSERYPDVYVERLVTRDRPADALMAESRRAQLVVVGSRGRGTGAGLLLGSVSHAVLHKSHCSVGVVRPPVEQER